jgi:hypothetical protein
MGSVEARKIQGLDASHPPRQFTLTLKVTVPEDEYRMVTIGRVASCALVGGRIRTHPP